MRVIALAGYDSFINTARLIAPYFEHLGCSVDFALVNARQGKQVSGQQIDRLGLKDKARWVGIESICKSGELASYDIVLCCLEGTSTRQLLHHVAALAAQRPLLISVYPGLVLRYQYDGYSMRTGSDLVWLNCQADKDAYTAMSRAFGLQADNARVFGIAPLLQTIERAPDTAGGPIVFFEQAVIPRYYDERLYLADRLIRLAKVNPNYEFLIKARTSGNDATLHQTWFPIDELLEKSAKAGGGLPPNMKLTSQSASSLLSGASHCLTVCSTVAAEAINAGVPTAIIGDFGAHEDYGLHYFFDSGLIRSFGELKFPFQTSPVPAWCKKYLADPRENIAVLIAEAVEQARLPRQPMEERPRTAEMAEELRHFLVENNDEQYMLSRRYQRGKPGQWTARTLVRRLKTVLGI